MRRLENLWGLLRSKRQYTNLDALRDVHSEHAPNEIRNVIVHVPGDSELT
jgi:hypothetical protein